MMALMSELHIRGIDEATARRFKANAALLGLTLAQYLERLVAMDAETPNGANANRSGDTPGA